MSRPPLFCLVTSSRVPQIGRRRQSAGGAGGGQGEREGAMFELLANYKDLQTITWTQTSATASGGPYGCMPTYSNWNCVVHPAPSACPRPAAARAPPRQAMARACVRIAAGGVMCWDRSGSRIKTMSGGRRVRRLRGRLEEGLDGAAGGRRLRVLGPPGVRPRHGQRRLPVGRVSCGRYRAGLARPSWRGPATAAAAGASAVLQRGKLSSAWPHMRTSTQLSSAWPHMRTSTPQPGRICARRPTHKGVGRSPRLPRPVAPPPGLSHGTSAH